MWWYFRKKVLSVLIGFQVTPPDPNASVVNIQFSRALSSIRLSARSSSLFWPLLYIIYGGVKDDIKELKVSIKNLSDSYQEAVTSGIKVQELITKAPTLELDIKGLKDSMELLNPRETHDAIVALKPVPEQLKEIKKQLDNMQFQIHHPGK
jgi:hypothetical protein